MAKIFIAVGHGGSDPGAVANGLKESDMALATALKCKSELERHGAFSKDSGAVRIHSVKLEIGNVPTRYIPPSYQENQEACGQAYQVIGTTTVAMSEQISYFEGGVAVIDCVHPTRMYSLGVVKKAHSVEIADLKIHQGGLLADKSKLSFGEYVSDGHYFGIRWTGVSPNLNTTDRRPQYANMVGLRLEAEISNT